MKSFTVAVLCFALSLPLIADGNVNPSARGRFAEPAFVEELNVPFSELLQSAALSSGPRLRPTPNVVLEGSEAGFVFPIVGSTAAGGGLFFRSETVIYNRSNRAQDVALYYFPIGGGAANCTRPARVLRFAADTWMVWGDFVPEVFGTGGLGAVIALAVTSSGQVDTTARIDGNSRIYTPQPGTSGFASQNFPSMSLSMPPGIQVAFGLRLDEQYRSNWGIFNYDVNARTFEIYANGTRGSGGPQVVTIDACSAVLSGVQGGPYGSYELGVVARDGRALFFSFASSVDNVTGDSWSVVGRSF